jgi:hypothetical protein
LQTTCQSKVAAIRNRLAHTAGFYPAGPKDIDDALSAIRSCLSLILK